MNNNQFTTEDVLDFMQGWGMDFEGTPFNPEKETVEDFRQRCLDQHTLYRATGDLFTPEDIEDMRRGLKTGLTPEQVSMYGI